MTAREQIHSIVGSELATRYICESNAAINIFEGAKRSGKTFSASLRFAIHCAFMKSMHANSGVVLRFVCIGRTMDSVYASVVLPLKSMFSGAVQYKLGLMTLFGTQVDIVGANDERHAATIQGRTYGGALFEEATILPRNIMDMALAQLSVGGSKAFMTCNPDSPYHWIYTDLIQRAGGDDIYSCHWRMSKEYNPSLTDDYIRRMHRLWPIGSVFYRRNIIGEWCVAEGLVFDMFDAQKHIVKDKDLPRAFGGGYAEAERYVVGVDYGTNNPCTFGLYGDYGRKVILLDEYYYDSNESGKQRTDAEHAVQLRKWLKGRTPDAILCDPSAASFIQELRRNGFRVLSANNDVNNGNRLVQTLISTGQFFVHERCVETIREFALYQWDRKAQDRGDDKPLKEHDHCMDRNRYALTYMRRIPGGPEPSLEEIADQLPI